MEDKVAIRLTRLELSGLNLVLGFALGAAMNQHERTLANLSLVLVNAINRDNPNFTPYEIPGEPEKK